MAATLWDIYCFICGRCVTGVNAGRGGGLRPSRARQEWLKRGLRWHIEAEHPGVSLQERARQYREFKRQNTRIMSYSCEENEKDQIHLQPKEKK